MNKIPPLLPEETLARLVRVARFDGMGVLVLSGMFALVAGSNGDRVGVIVGVLAAGAGAIELHGINEIYRGESRGLSWMIFSQVALLVTILAYCSYQFTHVDLTQTITLLETTDSEMKAKIEAAGFTLAEFARYYYFLIYTLVAVLTTIYSIVISVYYLRRRRAVELALAPDA